MNEIDLQKMKHLAESVAHSRLHSESELRLCNRFQSHGPAIGPLSVSFL